MKNLFEFFVEYLPKEFGRVELIADSYRNVSLKREKQEGRGASAKIQIARLKSKDVNNVHHGTILRIGITCKKILL